jgi:hypothetical protein
MFGYYTMNEWMKATFTIFLFSFFPHLWRLKNLQKHFFLEYIFLKSEFLIIIILIFGIKVGNLLGYFGYYLSVCFIFDLGPT